MPAGRESIPAAGRAAAKLLQAGISLLFVAVLVAYAGLIPLGQWQDEWDSLPLLVQHGWSGFAHRVLTWSPRPLSELLLFGYAHLVHVAGAPLIWLPLAVLWGLLALVLLALPSRLFSAGDQTWWPAALALFCLFLLGHPTGDMYYWPQGGAMAYVLSLAGIAGVAWLACATGLQTAPARRSAAALLTMSVLSAEVSAFFALVLGGVAAAGALAQRLRGVTAARVPLRWLAVPTAAAFLVLAVGAFGRLGTSREIFGDPAVANHALPAVLRALRQFVGELASLDGSASSWRDVGMGVAVKGLFFAGLREWSSGAVPRRAVGYSLLPALVGAASLATAFIIIAASYYQFGQLCCERHATFRQALVYLALFTLAWWLGRRRAAAMARSPAVGAMLLAVAVLLAAGRSWPALRADYSSYDARAAAAQANWAAGKAGTDSFTYRVTPPGRIVGGPYLPDGVFAAGAGGPSNVPHIVTFFRKKEVTFESFRVRTAPLDATPSELAGQPGPGAHCAVDVVNGQRYNGGAASPRGDGKLSLVGWVAPAAGSSAKIWVAAVLSDGSRRFFETHQEDRPDVAGALDRPQLKNAGFRAVLDLARVPDSRQLKFVAVSQGQASDCGVHLDLAR